MGAHVFIYLLSILSIPAVNFNLLISHGKTLTVKNNKIE